MQNTSESPGDDIEADQMLDDEYVDEILEEEVEEELPKPNGKLREPV